jgi:hypothetical protein
MMSETRRDLADRPPIDIEYIALREEIIKRIETRTQFISFTLTIGAAFLGLGWGEGAVALLIYPPLAALLAAGWANNEAQIVQVSAYIREHLEPHLPGPGWEHFRHQSASPAGGWWIGALSYGGIFLLTQLLAMFLGGFRFTGDPVQWLLMAIDVVSVLGVLLLINHVRRADN